MPNWRSRSSCSPALRRSSSSRRSPPGEGPRRRGAFVRSLSPRVVEDRPLSARHRGRRRGDPGRVARGCGRGRGRSAAVIEGQNGRPAKPKGPKRPFRAARPVLRRARRRGVRVPPADGPGRAQGRDRRRCSVCARDRLDVVADVPGPEAGSAPRTGETMTTVDSLESKVESLCRRAGTDPRASRVGAERAVVVDRGAAPDAAEQPRSRGRRAPGGARRLRRIREGGARSTTRFGRSCAACCGWARTRRCSSRAASPSASSGRTPARRGC